MSNSLAIFGPDRAGSWEAPDRQLALFWRQFAVLPEDIFDHQPLRSSDGLHMLVADARIDNVNELRGELDLPAGRDLSDAAVIMAAYQKWDAACLDRLVGDFAFAVWNSRDRSLFLARDALGTRPLLWARGQGFFGFATMPHGLLALPEVSRAVDERYLLAYLAFLPRNSDTTIYRDIHRLLPGHCLTVTPAAENSRQYWTPLAQRQERFRHPRESAEALLQVYTSAVRCRLRGIGGIGGTISAGWDGASVTALAARLLAEQGRRMTAFTAGPRAGFAGPTLDGRLADEYEIAAKVVRDLPNVDHVRVSCATRSHLAEIEAQSRFQELPAYNAINMVWLNRIAAEAKARGIRVLLTGAQGNLTASYDGYGTLPELFRRGRWLALARLLVRLSRRGQRLRSGLHLAIAPFLPPALYRLVRRAARREAIFDVSRDSYISPDLAPPTALHRIAAATSWDLSHRPPRDGRLRRMQAISFIDTGPLRPAMNARFGVDLRDPMVDRRLVELCLAIPEEHFLWEGRPSALFCNAMAGVLPSWLLEHRHRGLQSADWYEGLVAARDEIAEHVERLARSPLASRAFDIARLRTVIAALPDPETSPEELAKGNWGALEVSRCYGVPLLQAIGMGHFILRTEGGNE